MKKGEAQDLIHSMLKPLVADRGFRFKRGIDGGFFRSIPTGNQHVGVSLVDYGATFKFSLVVGIRLDEVENIVNKFNVAPPKYHLLTETFGARLDRFMREGEESQFVVVEEADIRETFVRLKPIIRERILPFLDAAQDIHTVAKAMNLTDVPKILPGAPNMSAIAIARLIQHPEFETIAATYQQRSSEFRKSTQENLQNFIEYLRGTLKKGSWVDY